MEALGGDRRWADRFLAEHAAVFYYWVLVVMYLVAPSASYAFCELVEVHAETTYAEFCEENAAALAALPPPLAALAYYKGGDLYLFDTLQTECRADAGGCEPRRPPCNTLLDVFRNIRDDEREHVKTMAACKSGRVALDARGWELGRADGGGEVDVAAGAGRASAGVGGGGGGDGAGRSG
jgi:ubiquinol oxidase